MMELSFAVSLVLIVCVQSCSSSLIVESPFGKIQGMEMTAKNNKKYVGFQGIPYAKPPVGKLRLAKPEPHPPLDGVFDASREIAVCPHPAAFGIFEDQRQGQEDCLTLNIYMKAVNSEGSQKKKVLSYIHGGAFIVSSSKDFDVGTFVTEQDVIAVTLNYRLGALGFLSTMNAAGPGNYGLWDQALAIKWVKDNIEAFGGDSKDITVAGESSGGTSTAYHALSPVMKGVFTKAFPMSGTSTSVFGLSLDAQADAVKFAKDRKCWSGSEDAKIDLAESEQLMNCIRELPLEDFTSFSDFGVDRAVFAPSVDGEFLPANPHELIKDDEYLMSVGFFDRKYLVGINNNEKALYQVSSKMIAHTIMQMKGTTEEDQIKMIKALHNATSTFYLRSRLRVSMPDRYKDDITEWYDRRFHTERLDEMLADLSFLIPSYDFLNAVAKSKATDAYFFYFNYYPSFMKGEYKGMPHAIDNTFWFDMDIDMMEKCLQYGLSGEMDTEDLAVKYRYSSLIASFIKTGNPSGAIKDKVPSGWPPYDLQGSHYLDFNSEPSVRRHLEKERRDLWLEKIPKMVVSEDARQKHHAHSEL